MIESQQTYEEPKEITINNVMYWEETSQTLRSQSKGKSLLTKAKKFLENNCIQRVAHSLTCWECLPIKDYNKTIYRINLTDSGWCFTLLFWNLEETINKEGNKE